RCFERMEDAARPTLAGVCQAAWHPQCLEILDCIGNLFVDGAYRILVLALDRDRLAIIGANHEHVDLAILADHRLAERDLAINDEALWAVVVVDVSRDQIAILVSGHSVSPSCSIASPLAQNPSPAPSATSRVRVMSTASPHRSLPRKPRPFRIAATPTD